ncbi:MAG: hypothetical protein A2096_14890 [Spirochaetes bacterium GWF1_41_5]|nr:MAG: hypothetical protein A2096_14890 [Spirochaetes bacterium GWF1_41_5]
MEIILSLVGIFAFSSLFEFILKVNKLAGFANGNFLIGTVVYTVILYVLSAAAYIFSCLLEKCSPLHKKNMITFYDSLLLNSVILTILTAAGGPVSLVLTPLIQYLFLRYGIRPMELNKNQADRVL